VPQVHRHPLARRAARMAQFAGGQRGGGDACLRGGANGERRGQHRINAGKPRMRQRFIGQARLPPDAFQDFGRIHHILRPSKTKGRVRPHDPAFFPRTAVY